jgi:streptomycin 6-kinase
MNSFVLPGDFLCKAIAQHGEEGRAWIERLPLILEHCRQRWNLTGASPVVYQSNASHYLAQARLSSGTPVVVKVHAPTEEFLQEVEALRLCAGRGMVHLLDADTSNQALLLEHLSPGTPLSQVADDEQAISLAATVMRYVWRPVPSEQPFPSLIDWGRGFLHLRQHYEGGSGPFPALLLEEAETLLAGLSASMTQRVLLHGDLHRENILAAQREPWLAIDPKGVIGEPAYETSGLVCYHLPDKLASLEAMRLLARRIDQLAEELDLDRTRVRNWALVQAVMSAWWIIEDGGDLTAEDLTCAQCLAAIKR